MRSKEEIHARSWQSRRLKRIAGALIEGPRVLHPPEELDSFGWLYPDLRLIHYQGLITRRSVAIYTDDTMNRGANFLKPVIRAAHWEGRRDLRVAVLPEWPSVVVTLSYFEDHRALVTEQIKAIQAALRQLPFVPYGLSAERDGPTIGEEDWLNTLKIYTNNGGGQSVEFHSPVLPAGDPLTEQFFAVFDGLLALMQPFAWDGWYEGYNTDPTYMDPGQSWYWHGQPLAAE